MTRLVIIFLAIIGLTGCVPSVIIQESIKKYEAVEGQVALGDPKDKVLSILDPTQNDLQSDWKKRPEKYLRDGVTVEIYFYRSRLQSDGLTTDDEFVPYVFNDGFLVAIGWTSIGGPKSQGQTTPQTNVNVQQTTIVY